ncbi:MAG: CopG family antitoxin [Candidatus Roizmanbacteria bacterium]
MKHYKLDSEEEQILNDIESGKFVSVDNLKDVKREAQEAAKNTMEKNKNINIRLSYKDIQRLKIKAMENGIPYQTLVASILHQYANDRIEARL